MGVLWVGEVLSGRLVPSDMKTSLFPFQSKNLFVVRLSCMVSGAHYKYNHRFNTNILLLPFAVWDEHLHGGATSLGISFISGCAIFKKYSAPLSEPTLDEFFHRKGLVLTLVFYSL